MVSPPVVDVEQMIRDHLKPDVPAELMRYTCGLDNSLDFVRTGAEVYTMLNLAAEKFGKQPLSEFRSTLDFGCGNGRILRFLDSPRGEVHGCDINESVVDFVDKNFPSVKVYCNPLMPPTKYQSSFFDLIYSFSVFSHLSLDVEDAWLQELNRIGCAGCLYLLTIHGDWYIEQALGDQATEARAKGFIWNRVHARIGGQNDFPEYYEASYHTSDYIRASWSKYFDILDIIKGDD